MQTKEQTIIVEWFSTWSDLVNFMNIRNLKLISYSTYGLIYKAQFSK